MNKKGHKKGQVEMGESIAIIIVVLILIILSMVFYAKIKESSINDKGILFEELDIVKISQIAYSLPEIQCSFAKASEQGCIDYLKVIYLAETINQSYYGDNQVYFYYRQLFGKSKIWIKTIELDGTSNEKLLYSTNSSGNKNTIRIPISIYDTVKNKNVFGLMIVEKYE